MIAAFPTSYLKDHFQDLFNLITGVKNCLSDKIDTILLPRLMSKATMVQPSESTKTKRLLRMTVAHYRQPGVSEEDFYRWVTEQHAVRAAKLHARNGIEGFSIVSKT